MDSETQTDGCPRNRVNFNFTVGNIGIEYHFAEDQYDRLPAMVSELLRRHVAVIAALTTPSALDAKTATTMIPIVFGVSEDPVKLGLVASIARPGGNATGVSFLLSELGAKQLGLRRQLVPAASRFGLLVNPNNENVVSSERLSKGASIYGPYTNSKWPSSNQ